MVITLCLVRGVNLCSLNEIFVTQLFILKNFFSLVISWVFYGEEVGILTLAGAGVVITSVYLMNKLEVTPCSPPSVLS